MTVRVFLNDGMFTPLGERTLFGDDHGTLTDAQAVQDMSKAAERVHEGVTDRRCPVVPAGRCGYSFNLAPPAEPGPRFTIVSTPHSPGNAAEH